MAPVYHALIGRGAKPLLWFTAQHVDEVAETLEDLRLPSPPCGWSRGAGAQPGDAVPGAGLGVGGGADGACGTGGQLRAALAADGHPPLVVVHGDTFTTPYGALLGRRLGARVAHLEAGMRTRSCSTRSPRRSTGGSRPPRRHPLRPTAREVENLRGARGASSTPGLTR